MSMISNNISVIFTTLSNAHSHSATYILSFSLLANPYNSHIYTSLNIKNTDGYCDFKLSRCHLTIRSKSIMFSRRLRIKRIYSNLVG